MCVVILSDDNEIVFCEHQNHMAHFFVLHIAKRKKNCMMVSKPKKVRSGLQFSSQCVGHLCVHLFYTDC